MPARILRDILVVDGSELACGMYALLFTPQTRFRVRFAEEYESLFKRSARLRPDVMLINSNSIPRGVALNFPCPALLILSPDRLDLKEQTEGMPAVVVVKKPFYPYDLVSLANKLVGMPRGKKRGRKKKNVS